MADSAAPATGAIIAGATAEQVAGRRTVMIRGLDDERSVPAAYRPALRRHERPGFRPDRAAMWAVVLGIFLVLVAVASAHAAVGAHELAGHALVHALR